MLLVILHSHPVQYIQSLDPASTVLTANDSPCVSQDRREQEPNTLLACERYNICVATPPTSPFRPPRLPSQRSGSAVSLSYVRVRPSLVGMGILRFDLTSLWLIWMLGLKLSQMSFCQQSCQNYYFLCEESFLVIRRKTNRAGQPIICKVLKIRFCIVPTTGGDLPQQDV